MKTLSYIFMIVGTILMIGMLLRMFQLFTGIITTDIQFALLLFFGMWFFMIGLHIDVRTEYAYSEQAKYKRRVRLRTSLYAITLLTGVIIWSLIKM